MASLRTYCIFISKSMTFSQRKKDSSIFTLSKMTILAIFQDIRLLFRRYSSPLPSKNQRALSSNSLPYKLKFNKVSLLRLVPLFLLKSLLKKQDQKWKEIIKKMVQEGPKCEFPKDKAEWCRSAEQFRFVFLNFKKPQNLQM